MRRRPALALTEIAAAGKIRRSAAKNGENPKSSKDGF
jgi:hypothetical protein